MPDRLIGKRVCITSAGGTLGVSLAQAFLHEGASVVWLPDPDRAVGAASSLDGNARGRCLDMRSEQSRRCFVDQLGEERLDVLVNHASIIDVREFVDLTEQDFDDAFETNVKAMTMTLVAVARHMAARNKGGSIINRLGQLGSTTRSRGASLTAAFNATNAAMTSITKSAALALAPHGIRVNGIAPGPIRMPMWESLDAAFGAPEGTPTGDKITRLTASIPQKRFGEAADLVGAMLFLASDEAASVTGQMIDVDGGHHLV